MAKAVPGGQGNVFQVPEGVLGLFEGVGGLRGVSGSLLPSFPFNVRKSQMRILNFFSRPEDPKCLKYQNVPNLGSFWAIRGCRGAEGGVW